MQLNKTAGLRRMTLAEARSALVNHRLYSELDSPDRTRVLMKHHVFAVWDFFSLLKRLQREVSCVEVPWLPRGLASHARFITEIVLAEECDEGIRGGYASHFELYLLAMDEVGADRAPIDGFVTRIHHGLDPIDALDCEDIPPTVREFVARTLTIACEGEAHEVAAAFYHGRENLLPDVLGAVQTGLGDSASRAPTFQHYLERHITLDHDKHGPLALQLLDLLCADDPTRTARAEEVGVEAIESRALLWDGVLAEIREREAGPGDPDLTFERVGPSEVAQPVRRLRMRTSSRLSSIDAC
jgi:hypothetical protein